MQTGQTTLLTTTTGDETAGSFGGNDELVFTSLSALVPGVNSSGSTSNVYAYNAITGVISLVSTTPQGTGGNGGSLSPVISAQGNAIIFSSGASNLVSGFDLATNIFAPTGPLYIFNNTEPELQQFSLSSPTYSVLQNGGAATVTIDREFGTQGTANVTVTASNGTATSGTDFTGGSQNVTFPSGATSETVTIPILSQSGFSGERTVNLSLSNNSPGVLLGAQPTAVLDIQGDTLTGGLVENDGVAISSNGDTYQYIAAQNGVLTLQVTPVANITATWTLTVKDPNGDSFIDSNTGSTDIFSNDNGATRVDLMATVGEVYTINVDSTNNAGAVYDLDVTNIVNRVQTAAGSTLQISGSTIPIQVLVGTPGIGDIGTGDAQDITISSPGFQNDTTYDAPTLGQASLLGTAAYAALQATEFLSNDGLFVDPSVPLPVTVSGLNGVAASTTSGTPVTINALSADSGAIPLTLTAVTTPAHGSATINPNNTIRYTPAPGFTGTDTFNYTADDSSGGEGTATVTVTVTQATTNNNLPTSSVNSLPATEPTSFTVSWSGTDVSGGGGIARYSIFESDNGGPFTALLSNTTQTSTTFNGVSGHTYGFYSVATDKAGKVQPTPSAAQATSTVTATQLPSSSVNPLPATESTSFTVSWSGTDIPGGGGIVSYSIFLSIDGGPFTAFITNTTQTSTTFTGQSGHTYGFYSVATDEAGKVQPTPTAEQATTTVVTAAGAPPTSTVGPLPVSTTDTSFTVSWSGSPGTGASSITSFEIFLSVDGGPFRAIETHTTATSLTFTGVAGNTYGFYSVATNNLGLVQATPAAAQATIAVLSSITPPPPPPPPPAPVIIGEKAVFTRKLNKKGKPTGKAVLTDFIFNFSAPLDQTTAAIAANYQLDSISTKKVKKKTKTILHPITGFTVSYIQATDSVDLKLIGTQAFPTGGRLTVLSGSPGEVSSASGTPLEGTTVFAISKKGTTINP